MISFQHRKSAINVFQRQLAKQADEKMLYYLARMDAQLNKLTKLISDLLDISKMETGKLVYREETFDLDKLINEIVENVQAATPSHHILIKGAAQVFGDRDRVGQVLINLLSNAIKYSPQANQVNVSIVKDATHVQVGVQDFGIGIAHEHQQKIFERFYQVADAEERTSPGLGIGLYLSSEILKRHGGRSGLKARLARDRYFISPCPPLSSKRLFFSC